MTKFLDNFAQFISFACIATVFIGSLGIILYMTWVNPWFLCVFVPAALMIWNGE